MIQSVYEQIVSTFNELKGTNQPFVNVYEFMPADVTEFPFVAVLDADNGEQVDQSTHLKVLEVNFIAFCLYRQKGTAESRKQIREDLWTVLQKFTEKGVADYLNNTAIKVDLKHELVNITEAEQPMTGFAIHFSCKIPMDVL